MNRFAGWAFAFCTLLTFPAASGHADTAPSKLGENFAHYTRTQFQWGATNQPLAAQLHYKTACYEHSTGNTDQAIAHLNKAVELDPGFPDSYFTLSRIMFLRFDPDALYYFVRGWRAVLGRFHYQSLLVVNAVVIGVLLLLMLITVSCVSFAARYLPFLAHKLAEYMETRFNASLPRTSAYLLVLLPFALLPGFVFGVSLLILMTWYFMQRREKIMMAALILPFILFGVLTPQVTQLNSLADPKSFTHLASRSTYSASSAELTHLVEQLSVPGLDAEKYNVLGLLHYRQENYDVAASQFLRAISLQPGNAMGYVNLGNVYYSQGEYQKALEGYRKAAQIDDANAIGQYNLAQAYIKTLLMAESSKALGKAAAGGIDDIKHSFAAAVRPNIQVFPMTFTSGDLWRIARIEGQTRNDFLGEILLPLTRVPARTSAWIFLAAFVTAIVLSRIIRNKNLTFQCSNCGELTCDNCCGDSGGTYLCRSCAGVIDSVSSDKVMEALLRQRRQSVLVRRRRAIRMLTQWLPGMRDFYYGRLSRGVLLTLTFSFSIIQLFSRGFLVKDWNALSTPTELWKWILPASGIVLAYLASIFSKRYLEVRNYRSTSLRPPKKDFMKNDSATAGGLSA